MFLITTADQRFWKTDEPVLFLGEWCNLFSQSTVWEKLTYEVLPYHWDDRKKLYQDYLYLDKLYEETVLHLADQLNKLHGVRYSLRYWRIVIGPWLYCFIQMLYDRYQSILAAIESGKVTNTLISKYDGARWLPQDFLSFINYSLNNDVYNHYLYSLIIEITGKIPFEVVATTDENNHEGLMGIRNPFSPKKILTKLVEVYGRIAGNHSSGIVFISSYFSLLNMLKLQLSLKQIPYLYPPAIKVPEVKLDLNMRDKLFFASPRNEFEQLLHVIIRKQIPSICVEGYVQMNERALMAYPRKPRLIVTANAYYFDEAFKFWAGYHCDHGTKLVGMQHGGHYGTCLWSSREKHEIKICDRYYTWGWKSDIFKNTKRLAATKLNGVKKSIQAKKDGRILLVLMSHPRYFYYMSSAPASASGMLSYFNDQYRFVRALSRENQKQLLVRFYPADYGWCDKERWKTELPDVETYVGKKSMLDQLKDSRLFICTYDATTYLETFAANFPTVMFWNPDQWELRPSAKPYFDELSRAGIFHDTPESAADLLNKISHDPASWWNQAEIQSAKDKFCFQFARTSDNWLDEWKKELAGLIK
jgi:putative transferase (TIGR04331 family)